MNSHVYIDAHCHLTDDRVYPHASEWIVRAENAQIQNVRIGGLFPEEWQRQQDLKTKHPHFIRTSFGLHPWWIERWDRQTIDQHLRSLREQIRDADAIGETGLDFFAKRDASRFADQEYAFRAQVRLALQFQKPLVLHVVHAHEEAIKVIQEAHANTLPIQIHSFSGSLPQAKAWTKLGAYLSFSGTLLRSNADPIRQALKSTPLSQVLFETDSPDQPWRSDRVNEPSLIPEIYQFAAKLLGLDVCALAQIVADNFQRFG